MKNLLQFIKSKKFLKHLLSAVFSLFLFFGVVFGLLNIYTLHGEVIEVPDFKSMKMSDVSKIITEKKMQYLIIDSVYYPKEKAGIVVNQDPESASAVKKDRTIYLTVTAALPPQVKMPNLVDEIGRAHV